MLVGMALETLSTALVVPVIALMTEQDFAGAYPFFARALEVLGNPGRSELVLGAMLGLAAVYLVKNLFLAYLAWRQAGFTYGVQANVSQRLFSAYLRQPYAFHLQRNSAQLIRNATREVALLTEAVLSALTVASELLVALGIAALLLAIEPVGAVLAVLVLATAGWTFHQVTRRRLSSWGERRQLHEGLRIQHLQQGLGGAKEAILLGREAEFLGRYAAQNEASARLGHFQVALLPLPRLLLEVLAIIGLVTLVAAMLLQGKTAAMLAPTAGLFAVAAFRLLPSANRTLSALQILRHCLPSVELLGRELALAVPAPQAAPGRDRQVTDLRGDIRLVDLGYTYEGAPAPALKGLDVTIRKGEAVGFVGPSGAGKSTLVDVILGLLRPGTGRVLVDGKDIQENLRAWQDQIGYVPQTIYLTDDSLRRNVAFGLPDEAIDEAAVRRALRAAQLEEFVAGLPEGLNTMVGERGVRLSGGQRQRIGIARALYHDPAVLVLDEATSSLDAATERGVIQAVNALHGTKTLLIVAHRISTVAGCDRLYRLERGQIAAETVPSAEQAAAHGAR